MRKGCETRDYRKSYFLFLFGYYYKAEEGEQTGERLYAELQVQGYVGSLRALYRYLHRWRPKRTLPEHPEPAKHRPRRGLKTAPAPGPFDECRAKEAVWWYMRSPNELTATEQAHLAFLRQVHPTLETAYQLVQEFVAMLRQRAGGRLETWLEQVRISQIPELTRFRNGVEQDKAPVQAALQLPYSTGVVEGHVHRLKLIKRQGYGRAAFPLLRQRVLFAA